MIPGAPPYASHRPVELACRQLHPVRCGKLLQANSPAELITVAMEHGAWAHGFTPVWYSKDRQDAMREAVTDKCRDRQTQGIAGRPSTGRDRRWAPQPLTP